MIILLFLLVIISQIVHADVYVITASDKSVYSISEADDAVIPNGYKKDIIKNKKISDLTVSMGEEKLYDFSGTKFTLNSKKVSEKNKAENDALLSEQKQVSDKASAIEKLKDTAKLTDDEIKALLNE